MVAIAAGASLRAWRAVASVALVYGCWELWHTYLSGDWRDSLVDWASVMGGAVAGLAAWQRRGALLGGALVALLGGVWIGVRKRQARPEDD
jgi:hypothetical protein